MRSGRLEAFSDGVLAIIITIMVLELEPPKEAEFEALFQIAPTFICYLASFLYVSIYWYSHHQLFKISTKINKNILWANLHLLFWLSLIPFTTSWIGNSDNHKDGAPVILYGFILLMCEIALILLKSAIVKLYGEKSTAILLLKRNLKDFLFLFIYIIGLSLAFLHTVGAISCFLLVGFLKIMELRYVSKKNA